MVKLGKTKDPKGVTANVIETYDEVQFYPNKDIHDDGLQTISNIDVSTTIPVANNITNLGMIPYYYKNYIFFPWWFGLPSCLLFLFWANVCVIHLDSIFNIKNITS
jgi:hypothetical protein